MDRSNLTERSQLILAFFMFGTVGIFRKFIPIPSGLLAFYRGLLGAIYLYIVCRIQKPNLNWKLPWKSYVWFIVSGMIMGINWMLLFESYTYTSVSIATLCYNMQPTILILLSPFFFHESLGKRKIICVLLSFIGITMVSGIFEGSIYAGNHLVGVIYGLLAAFLYATVVILNKKLPQMDAYQKTTIQLFSAACVMIPYLLFTNTSFQLDCSWIQLALLLIVCFFHTGYIYALYFKNIEAVEAQTIAIFSYLDPITALFLSALILKEQMSIFGILGAVLILASAYLSEKKS